MGADGPQAEERVRAVEIIASLCLATDLGMGFPIEHGLRATLMTMRLCDLLNIDAETASQTYYASLLMYSGCTTDTDVSSQLFVGGSTKNITPVQFGGPLEALAGVMRALSDADSPRYRRAYEIVTGLPRAAQHLKPHFTTLCEVAEMLAERLGMPPATCTLFTNLTERWDGKGVLRRAAGEDVPLPLRIVHVARDAAFQRVIGGDEHALAVVGRRAGGAFDPEIVEVFRSESRQVFAAADTATSAWDATVAVEPRPWLTLHGESIDRAISAMGNFADLVSPYLAGHSAGVAELAAAAAGLCGFSDADKVAVRRAGQLHDLGRVAVHPLVWTKSGDLTAYEWEQVRLHPYHTERIVINSSFLAPLGSVAGAHHERVDGSGYHRGATASALPPAARLLAAADAYRAKVEPRSYREPCSSEDAASHVIDKVKRGTLDAEMVAAVVEAAGQPHPRFERPAGLTEREVEVVAMVARGKQTKHVARALDISVKTADRHIQNAYRKIGVSTRAAATLFAMEHGLISWGEFPISRSAGTP